MFYDANNDLGGSGLLPDLMIRLNSSSLLVACLSENYIQSNNCMAELNHARQFMPVIYVNMGDGELAHAPNAHGAAYYTAGCGEGWSPLTCLDRRAVVFRTPFEAAASQLYMILMARNPFLIDCRTEAKVIARAQGNVGLEAVARKVREKFTTGRADFEWNLDGSNPAATPPQILGPGP